MKAYRAQFDEPDEPDPVDPDPVVPTPDQPTTHHQREWQPYSPQTTSGWTEYQRYMYEQHGNIVEVGGTPSNYSEFAFTSSGEVALYGDPELEKRLGLPEHVRAVMSQNNVVHTTFDHTIEIPKYIGMHDVNPAHEESVLIH